MRPVQTVQTASQDHMLFAMKDTLPLTTVETANGLYFLFFHVSGPVPNCRCTGCQFLC